jgi:hypothetical protein
MWRTVKYDYLYLNPAVSGIGCRAGIATHLRYYNDETPQSSFGSATHDTRSTMNHASTSDPPNPAATACSLLNEALRLSKG